MLYRALVTFSGLISMRKGEVKAIKDSFLVADLLRAKYIEPLEKPKEKKTSKKGGAKNDIKG